MLSGEVDCGLALAICVGSRRSVDFDDMLAQRNQSLVPWRVVGNGETRGLARLGFLHAVAKHCGIGVVTDGELIAVHHCRR